MSSLFRAVAQYTPLALVGVSFVGGCCRMISHAYLASYISRKSAVNNDITSPLSAHLHNLVTEVADNFLGTLLTPKEFADFHFYLTTQPNMYSRGSTNTLPNCLIGIPEHFQYSDVAQILAENSNFTTDDINSDDRLSSCLVLSESAKKFALTSEIHALNTYYIMFKFDFVPLLSLYCFVWDKLQKKVEKGHPLIQIVLFVGLMVAVVALGYIFEDQYEKWRIVQGDTKTALINGEYLDGGREYLQKQIEMNKVLRYLNKNGGQMKYTEDGETVQNFFNFGIPSLHTRLENLERLRQET
ncbi:uncharacterized protein LOC128232692 isoform X2 [Mya arenaria]|uniref:uncharacterized protein LOC128232692 isoform X2 n=1 Tax=Mya arenaria TaxID=6604 RepID=UPI0022E0788F|nr:uncharacterized protein LOC128232692 isoform X2 [Mya arenaria]